MKKLFKHVGDNKFKLFNLLTESSPYLSGMKHDAARPAGSHVFDATVYFGLTTLMLDTKKGSVELVLTPEQIEQLKAEIDNLK